MRNPGLPEVNLHMCEQCVPGSSFSLRDADCRRPDGFVTRGGYRHVLIELEVSTVVNSPISGSSGEPGPTPVRESSPFCPF